MSSGCLSISGYGRQLTTRTKTDCDYAVFNDFITKAGSSANRCGEIACKYVEALRDTLVYRFKEDSAKSALQHAWTTGVLRLVGGTKKKDESGYSRTEIEGGDLVITVFSVTNVSDTGSKLLDTLADASTGLPAKAVLNWNETDEARKAAIERAQAAAQLSTEVTLEIDQTEFGAKLSDINRIGDITKSFMEAVASRFEREFAKDDIARAAFQGKNRVLCCSC